MKQKEIDGMSEYWLLRLIMAGGVIGPAAALNLMGKSVQAAFRHTYVRKGIQV